MVKANAWEGRMEDPLIRKRLEQMLSHPHEELDVEYKNWVDITDDVGKGKIAKSLLALANHGGGFVVIGFNEGQTLTPDLNKPAFYQHYKSDAVNNVVKRYAEPTFQCRLWFIAHPTNGIEYPIVQVPGGHKLPIRCKSDGPKGAEPKCDFYYIRRTGPESSPPKTAHEWNDLIQRCILNSRDNLLDSLRLILSGEVPSIAPTETVEAQLESWIASCDSAWTELVSEKLRGEAPGRFTNGYWSISYKVLGLEKPMEIENVAQILKQPNQNDEYPGWGFVRKTITHSEYDTDKTVQFYNFGASNDYPGAWSWYCRAGSDLSFFLRGGHAEDMPNRILGPAQPGTVLYCSAPVAYLRQSFRHALRVCQSINRDDLRVLLTVSWQHMRNRELTPFSDYDRTIFSELSDKPFATNRDTVTATAGEIDVSVIETNLSEIILGAVKSIYRAFGFTPEENLLKRYLAHFRTEYDSA